MSALSATGIDARLPGSKSTLGKGLGLTDFSDQTSITLDNVHRMTLYELRQSLMHRGHFKEDYTGPITYELLLTTMISLLKSDVDALDASKAAEIEKSRMGREKEDGTVETLQERLKREREERKREAVERSRRRQADKAYFTQKKDQNSQGMEEVGERKNKKLAGEGEEYNAEEHGVDEGREGEKDEEEDPFKLKFRSKIGGQYA
mmetsp:Transcript_9379/g.18761  ORF Transcript_9379/g.18761 Transcript_9379/m.18761 type:complete len:205 (+) Transcript_9379:194-808(+)